MKIESRKLTTCEVGQEGRTVTLQLIDAESRAVSLTLSFDQAQVLTMTLPHLLTLAMRKLTQCPDMRYVFPLGDWRLELAADQRTLILSQQTRDGFEVSFSMAVAEAEMLGRALSTQATALHADGAPPAALARLN
ncbi:MAG: hypothetical protein IT537_23170 [Hyphomicrobiales bacterium]|nr:hypothetical protein [Hyphomicrobiales bacterium]